MPFHESFHVELRQPATDEQVRQALEAAGISVFETRPVSQIHDGVSVTETLLQGIWNHQTGQAECAGGCSPSPSRHVPYDALNPSQRTTFAESVADFMAQSRQNAYQPADFLNDDGEFLFIALTPCASG